MVMRNGCFVDSELEKDEVDDMEECLEHFEVAESSFPISGRTLSDNELSEILSVVKNKTLFSMDYDDSYDEKRFGVRIPLSREALISAEVEQELVFAWGNPFYVTWDSDLADCWTEYQNCF